MIDYYYNLEIPVPGYIGGYFWGYYAQDMIPHTNKPLWNVLIEAIKQGDGSWSLTSPSASISR